MKNSAAPTFVPVSDGRRVQWDILARVQSHEHRASERVDAVAAVSVRKIEQNAGLVEVR